MKHRLHTALTQVDHWLAGVLDGIDPLRGDAPEEYLFRCKCLSEMAGYLIWRERLGDVDRSALAPLRQHVLARIDGDFLSLAARDPARILIFCSSLSYALRHRSLAAQDEALARRLLSAEFAWSVEWLPCRQLDLLQACRAAGLDGPVDARDVVGVSSLVTVPSPLNAGRESYYSLTHSVFYAYLLGVLDAPRTQALHESIEGGMCRTIALGDLDLGLELVASAQLSGLRDSPAQRWLLDEAVRMLQHDGALSAERSGAVRAFVERCPGEAFWAERIHVTQVAGMALSSALHLDALDELGLSDAQRETVSALGEALEALQRRRWVAGLNAAERFAQARLAHPVHQQFPARILAFIDSNRRNDGGFGHFVEERALYRRMRPGGDFDADVLAAVQSRMQVASDILQRTIDIGVRSELLA